jgi:hypothetical protein
MKAKGKGVFTILHITHFKDYSNLPNKEKVEMLETGNSMVTNVLSGRCKENDLS